jgi:predicted DNA-binding protein (UPF0251 family)
VTAPSELVSLWLSRAEILRRHGAAEAAHTAELLAEELEAALRAETTDTLSLPEAAKESGFSARTLSRLIRRGRLTNAGTESRPRIRRSQLPRKARPTLLTGAPVNSVTEIRGQMARAIAHSKPGATDGTRH